VELVTWLRIQWDRVLGWALIVAGAGALLGAARSRNSLLVADQLPFLISGAFTALACGLSAASLLISASCRDEWRKLHRVSVALSDTGDDAGPPAGSRLLSRLRWDWDRTLAFAAGAAGFAVLILGSSRVADALLPVDQVVYVSSAGVGGLFLVAVAAGVLILVDLNDEAWKLEQVCSAVVKAQPGGASAARRPATVGRLGGAAALGAPIVGLVVITAGVSRSANALRLEAALDGLTVSLIGWGIAVGALVTTLVVARRRLSRRAQQLFAILEGAVVDGRPGLEALAGRSPAGSDDDWTAPNLAYVHRAECPTLQHVTAPVERAGGSNGTRKPCLLCHDPED
jgi:hypothetical protein